MPIENSSEPIGDPQPIDSREGRAILKRIGAFVALSLGGLVTFALFVTPARLAGASRSARLRWQQRQQEIQQTLDSAHPCETKDANGTAKDLPPVPARL
jgi:hypothetical protein